VKWLEPFLEKRMMRKQEEKELFDLYMEVVKICGRYGYWFLGYF